MVHHGVLQWVLGLGPGYRSSVPWFETLHDLLLFSEESRALGVGAELKQVDNAGVWCQVGLA